MSHTAHYGPEPRCWDDFWDALVALPKDMTVLGINDYMWVDGYARVRDRWQNGMLPGVAALFPVVELRLDDFVGTVGKLSKVNAHVLFAPDTDPDLITQQFIPRLINGFKLADPYRHLASSWNAVPTRTSITELGRLIKSTVPKQELANYQDDFTEGFNNWVIPLDCVVVALEDSMFSETPLLALGKTEWEDIPWNENAIAAKKHLVNSADLLFTASPSPATCLKAVERLRRSGVNHRVLDCSDAHYFADSGNKDALGNCSTWICADPTLGGLRHALIEYRARVFIGDKPESLVRRGADPTHFISSVKIRPTTPGVTPAPSFDVELQLNSGFVAVVGNKGSGKSALLDCIGLACNAHTDGEFTFLSADRFCNVRNNRAPHFEVELAMADGERVGPLSLASAVDHDLPERVRYLPQSLLERLCNKEPGARDEAFERELRSIIFSHVPEHQRLNCQTLDQLLELRGQALDRKVTQLRTDQSSLNRVIAEFEERARPSRGRRLRARLAALERQLTQHDAARPQEPAVPVPDREVASANVATELNDVRGRLSALGDERERLEASYGSERRRLDAATNLLTEIRLLQSTFADFGQRVRVNLDLVGLRLDDVARLVMSAEPIEAVRAAAEEEVAECDRQLSDEGDLAIANAQLVLKEAELEGALDAPRRQYEQARRELAAWDAARKRLTGTTTTEDTIEFFAAQLEEYRQLPARLTALRERRLDLTREIHAGLLAKVALYRELYEPVQLFLQANPLAREQFSLEFSAALEVRRFADRFLSLIDRGASGTFYGIDASQQRVDKRVAVLEPQDAESVRDFVASHELDLRADRRSSEGPQPEVDGVADALRKGATPQEVYDLLFGLSYLDPQYELRSGGRPISELSPGQKGTILLMFYLLIDKTGRPIVLDQPDENLDNHTIHTLLRPAIRAARLTRQVIVVTHSPNLAVVGDADQVIVASRDDEGFHYESGSIENPTIRDLVVGVLEGTWPAYNDRGRKYHTTTRTDSGEEIVD
jgi:ABC-type lipoprotein export system ATPase subunit